MFQMKVDLYHNLHSYYTLWTSEWNVTKLFNLLDCGLLSDGKRFAHITWISGLILHLS